MSITKKNENIHLYNLYLNLSLFLYNVFVLLYYAVGEFRYLQLNLLIGMLLLVVSIIKISKFDLWVYCFSGLVIVGILLNQLFVLNSTEKWFDIFLFLSHIGIAIAILKWELSKKICKVIFAVYTLFFSYFIFTGTYPGLVFPNASKNSINHIFLMVTILLIISYIKKGDKPPYIPIFISLAISIWTMGRTGIISNIILLQIVFFYVCRKYNDFKLIFVPPALLLAVLVFFNVANYNVNEISSDIKSTIEEEPRFEIMSNYIKDMDAVSFILGSDYKDNTQYFHSGNMHNSFIDGHIRMGITAIIMYLLFFVALFISILNSKVDFIIVLAIMVRIFSDTIMFFGRYDFILFFMVIWIFYKKIYENKCKESLNFYGDNERM